MLLRATGSKARVARKLIGMRPATGLIEYREPCCASASVFFHLRPGMFQRFWLNDKNADIHRFYQTFQRDHTGAFRRAILAERARLQGHRRVEERFIVAQERFKRRAHTMLDYLILNRLSFGQQVSRGRKNGASFEANRKPGRVAEEGMRPLTPERLDYCYERLRGVTLSCMDLETLLLAPARHGPCWVFMDPPYLLTRRTHDSGAVYEKDLTLEEHRHLFDVLRQSPHRWMMTYSACEFSVRRYVEDLEFRSPFRSQPGLAVSQLPIRYSGVPQILSDPDGKRLVAGQPLVMELLVWNYD